MGTRITPYISFEDNAREAMTFYHGVFGGELSMSTFAEFGAAEDPAEADLVMHAQLETPEGQVLMGADTPARMDFVPPAGISVSLSGEDGDRLSALWDGLSAGGTVLQPLQAAPWGDRFGMCVDRFGVTWLVNISAVP